ncbi:MAG: dTDP-4-keto-6-deoxy-D-glucose epimerase [Bacteroidetes bacterium]|nr:dTDP-4-keto-6-deoxy-D-glucose epimerase [Bacteroidota bacterium]
MQIEETEFEDLYVIQLEKKGDERGWFMRTFDHNFFSKKINRYHSEWKQMNHSFNSDKYTWRGFHFQNSPFQETKVIRCVQGKVLDCVLDLREHSRTYLKVFQVELSQDNCKMLYIPKGFAHGFLTLEDHSALVYLHDEYYMPEFESGVRFDDPKIKLTLPINPIIISDRDKNFNDL